MAKPAARKPAARKGASRNSRPAARRPVPAWLWLLLGLAFGLFVAFLWHLWELRKEITHKPAETTVTAPAGKNADDTNINSSNAGKGNTTPPADGKSSDKNGEPRFDFYTLLPNQQVMPGRTPAATPPVTTSTPSPAPAAKGSGPRYLLQAGSFKSEAEADKRRAALLLLGMPVSLQKTTAGDTTWFRVVVGPFDGKPAAETARNTLHGNGVDALLLKEK